MEEYSNWDSTIDTLPRKIGLARSIHCMSKFLEDSQAVRLGPAPYLEN